MNNNRPSVLEGSLTLTDADGNRFTLERDRIALCRCGQSSNNPFCDGTHGKVDFDSQIVAR